MFGGYPYTPYFNPQTGQIMTSGAFQNQYGMQQGQGMQQNGFQAAQNAQQTMEVVPVQTIQQVEQIGLQPGQRKMVMVQNDAVVALRVADPVSGLVDTKYFNLVEFDPHAVQTQVAPVNYVTADQLEERLAAFADSLKPARAKKDAKEAAE